MGREGPGCFISSLIVFQTMGNVPLSQTRDSPLRRPKLGQRRGEGGSLWGKKLSAKPNDQRNPPQTKESGEEGSKAKMSWVQTPGVTPAPILRQNKGSSYSVLINQCLFQAQHSAQGERMRSHGCTQAAHVLSLAETDT